jgi:tetraacyldisaccharide 4'-kinase
VETWLIRRWYGNSAPLPLLPLSWLFRLMVGLRRRTYERGWLRSLRVGRPVVIIGNLTVGGTGKTPLVAWLATELASRGLKPGIVSRGYGGGGTAPRLVQPSDDWRQVGDEPLLLCQRTRCPVVVAADRVAAARLLVERGVDVILADDGLQHLRLARDCEIVVVDAARGLGNGELLPAGPLREPVSRLGSADAIVVNGFSKLEIAPAALHMSLVPGEISGVTEQARASRHPPAPGAKVHAVAGIGNPARFFSSLRAEGFQVLEHAFADHHPYAEGELEFGDGLPVLMTEKDAVKCRAFANPRLWYVPVTARFADGEARELLELTLRKLGHIAPARG